MRIIMFYHSLLSDWNHGNAHFLRGIVSELLARGHEVTVYEPYNGWSLQNLIHEYGTEPIRKFEAAYPGLQSSRYRLPALDLNEVLDGADLVLVHEWNEPELIQNIGRHHKRSGSYALLFHDTHHRLASDPDSIAQLDLKDYDGVLAYGASLRALYEKSGRVRQAWTWHEAADTRVFHPMASQECEGDLVWIGNWGDGERSAELAEFLLEPVKTLGLKARAHGVRYPDEARQKLMMAGIRYCGWLPNFEVPAVFARHRVTLHIPRRPYLKMLPGIPTIRPFEALACAIPLICSPWEDTEGLFTPGRDFLVARNGQEMTQQLKTLLHDEDMARELSRHGLETIRARHTCAHRVDELLEIVSGICGEKQTPNSTATPSAPAPTGNVIHLAGEL
jgi:spore maturation protein CgeB